MDARRFRLRYIGRNALFYETPLLLDRLSSLSLNGKSSLSLGPATTSISLIELSSLKCSLDDDGSISEALGHERIPSRSFNCDDYIGVDFLVLRTEAKPEPIR